MTQNYAKECNIRPYQCFLMSLRPYLQNVKGLLLLVTCQ
jgi:hypothetical protein